MSVVNLKTAGILKVRSDDKELDVKINTHEGTCPFLPTQSELLIPNYSDSYQAPLQTQMF